LQRFNVQGNLGARQENVSTKLGIKGFLTRSEASINFDGQTDLASGFAEILLADLAWAPTCYVNSELQTTFSLRAIKTKNCSLRARYGKDAMTSIDMSCRIFATPRLGSTRPGAQETLLPLALDAVVTLQKNYVSEKKTGPGLWHGTAEANLAMQNVMKNGEVKTSGRMKSKFYYADAKTGNKPSLQWDVEGSLDFNVARFSSLVKALAPTTYAVPAPFNQLDGEARVKVNLKGDSLHGFLRVPFALSTRLSSEGQKLFTDTTSFVEIKKLDSKLYKTNFDASIVLSDVVLILPYISLRQKLPLFFPDRRIERGDCVQRIAGHSNHVTYRIGIKTPDQKPVLITSKFSFKTYSDSHEKF
jgi:hypothetical protein